MTVAANRFDNAKRRRSASHVRQAMLTPSYVLEPIRAILGRIDLDPCTEPDNPTRAEQFYCLPKDGCTLPWHVGTVFCNPPYGEARERWIDRCIAEAMLSGTRIVLLIPAAVETAGCQKALKGCSSVLFPTARLRFNAIRDNGRSEAASHPSAIFGFNVDLAPIGELGVVCYPRPIEPMML